MSGSTLFGRSRELEVVDRLLAQARGGAGGALLLQGEPGIGKSALLRHAGRAGAGMRVLRATGVETEVELPFAGLHQLLHPVLDLVGTLPTPQAAALQAAFGLRPAPSGDRFLVALATLTLLTGLARTEPLLCLVDNLQWLDEPSVDALLFAARRLRDEPVAALFAARDSCDGSGITELFVPRLEDAPAAALLDERAPGLGSEIRDRILRDALGNPLALLELGKAAGTVPLPPGDLPMTGRLLHTFHHRAEALPPPTRTLLLLLAADDTGELSVALRAGELLGIPARESRDLEPAEVAGLIRFSGDKVEFLHPLMRTAVYQSATHANRLAAHRAIAHALDDTSTDRRTWHLAASATGPDEAVAQAMETVADNARNRVGHAAAVSAYVRAARLSPSPEPRARRLARAAEAAIEAGRLRQANTLADEAAGQSTDQSVLSALARVQAAVEFDLGSPATAGRILAEAARPIEDSDPQTAALMLAQAVRNSSFGGDPTLAHEAALRLSRLPLPVHSTIRRLIPSLRSLAAALHTGSPSADAESPHQDGGLIPWAGGFVSDAAADLRDGVRSGDDGVAPDSPAERLLAASLALIAADDVFAEELSSSVVAEAREHGMIGLLPRALAVRAQAQLMRGLHPRALESANEGLRIGRDIGQTHHAAHLGALIAWLSAAGGEEADCRAYAGEAVGYGERHGIVTTSSLGTWALGLLELGLGRFGPATEHLRLAWRGHPVVAAYSTFDLVEAASRSGAAGLAEQAFADLEAWSSGLRRPWVAAATSRCRALISTEDEAERHFMAALAPPGDDQPFQHARSRLLYGEWLRRRRRKAAAREHLRLALDAFIHIAAHPWAARARAELQACGGTPAPWCGLTPQELQVVRLAAEGLTNKDIAARLVLSPRTVARHLYKAYPKLGITSRTELPHLIPDQAIR